MTTPSVAAGRFVIACLQGGFLGILYGFLRPLRPKRTAIADSLFIVGLLWTWLILSFDICRGDIRPGYTAGLFLGAWGFDRTVGRLLQPAFRGFWRGISWIFRSIFYPIRKFFQKMWKFIKFLFASLKKWGTIKWNKRCHVPRASGGSADESQETPFIRKGGIPKEHRSDEDRHSGSVGVVYRRHSGSGSSH